MAGSLPTIRDRGPSAAGVRSTGGGGERGLDPPDEVLEIEGFGQIVEDAVASRERRRLDAAAGGDENDAGIAPAFLDGVDEVETGPVAEVDIGDDEIEVGFIEGGDAIGGRSRTFDSITLLAEGQRHHFAQGVVIIDHEDPLLHRVILPRAGEP